MLVVVAAWCLKKVEAEKSVVEEVIVVLFGFDFFGHICLELVVNFCDFFRTDPVFLLTGRFRSVDLETGVHRLEFVEVDVVELGVLVVNLEDRANGYVVAALSSWFEVFDFGFNLCGVF